jgi:hypothetical protein
MANKPDKYGVKFWLLVDVKTHYCLNECMNECIYRALL